MKRRAVTLIEVIVSFSLLTILLTTLLFWYSDLAKKKHARDKLRRPLRQEYFAYKRLEKVLEKATLDSDRGTTIFSGAHDSQVVFTFDNGIDEQPALCDVVVGKLSIVDHQLRLDIWPQPRKGQFQTEPTQSIILLDGVEAMECSYLAGCYKRELTVSPGEVKGKAVKPGWKNSWSPEYPILPSLVTLKLQGEHDLTWTFDLKQPIYYPLETA